MKKLIIDTTDRKKIIVGLEFDGKKKIISTKKNTKSQAVLPMIRRLLEKEKIDFKDLTQIEVNPGPGSFTGLRVGISVANAMGSILRISVNGGKVGQLVKPRYT